MRENTQYGQTGTRNIQIQIPTQLWSSLKDLGPVTLPQPTVILQEKKTVDTILRSLEEGWDKNDIDSRETAAQAFILITQGSQNQRSILQNGSSIC